MFTFPLLIIGVAGLGVFGATELGGAGAGGQPPSGQGGAFGASCALNIPLKAIMPISKFIIIK